jgi:hypothetical protein
VQRFADHGPAGNFFLSSFAVCFEDQRNSLGQILSCFFERLALRIGTGQFFHERDVSAFRSGLEDGGEGQRLCHDSQDSKTLRYSTTRHVNARTGKAFPLPATQPQPDAESVATKAAKYNISQLR